MSSMRTKGFFSAKNIVEQMAKEKQKKSDSSNQKNGAPQNEIERKLIEMWEQFLPNQAIGTHDDFFELGGNSLLAIKLESRILKEFNVDISFSNIINNPTIYHLADVIQQADSLQHISIPVTKQSDGYPVSSAQKRIYVLQQFEGKHNLSYNIPLAFVIKGDLNVLKFEEAIKKLIKRHESLRTSFELVEGEPIQYIHTEVDFEIIYQNAENQEIDNVISDFIQPFDLSLAPLFRVSLFQLNKEKYLFLLDMHHIISDGFSMNILVQDFMHFYEGTPLSDLRIQYKDVAVWRKEQNETEVMKQKKKYWLNQFSDEVPILNLPTDFVRPNIQSFEGKQIDFKWDKKLAGQLKELARETKTTLYMVLMAAYTCLLSKYSGQEDIVVGSPVAGRNHPDLEPIVGMFVNTLAIRNFPENNKTFRTFLSEVKETTTKAIENENYPLEELVQQLDLQRDTSRNPLFNVMFNMLNMELKGIELEGLSFVPYHFEKKVSQFDLTFNVFEENEEILLSIEYCTKLFKTETIERMILHLKLIVQQIIDQPDIKLQDIDMLSKPEKQQILVEFNDTAVDYPNHKTVINLFEEQVSINPTHKAIIYDDKNVTYEELSHKVNTFTNYLMNAGVGKETIVCLLAERSIEMIAAILAIQKAGGAYLPIDCSYPKERIEYVFEDSCSKFLITNIEFVKAKNLQFTGTIIDFSNIEDGLNEEATISTRNEITPDHLAYIIYTSGSTGQPKGVMIEHSSLLNQILALTEDAGYNKLKNHMLYSKAVFDVSIQQIFTALCSGATLHLMTEVMEGNYEWLNQYIQQNNIDFIDMVPAQMEAVIKGLVQQQPSNRRFVLGGESFHSSLYKKIRKMARADKIYNMYGPTETTINALTYQCKNDDNYPIVPIGKPLRNYQAYILDKNMNLLPIGVIGELYISGEGVARGYLNRSDLTKDRFAINPFNKTNRMYKTGDFAKWLPDGNIEFVGRKDHQVKIRGYRIELGEIESMIGELEGVEEVAVLNKKDETGIDFLCAYIIKKPTISVDEMKKMLHRKMPNYMVPQYFIELDEMPLTTNGKVNRAQLLNLAVEFSSEVEYIPPTNEIENQILKTWQEVLGIEKIGIKDHFFELGGHSLKAVQIVSKLHKEMEVMITLKDIFMHPTIEQLARRVQSVDKNGFVPIIPVNSKEFYPVSSSQKQMFLLQQFEANSISYNIPFVLSLKGELNKTHFEYVVKELVARHESLRTSFELMEGEPVQRIHVELDFKVQYVKTNKHEADTLIRKSIQSFTLNQAPLFRVHLIQVDNEEHLLLIDMHHIISDGISTNILVQDFIQLYEGKNLPDLHIQYKDFAVWQKEQMNTEEMNNQEGYWLSKLSEPLQPLNLPTDYKRSEMDSLRGNQIKFTLNNELTEKLKKVQQQSETTMYMLLFAVYNVMLHKITGNEDITVGTPVSGRSFVNLDEVVGMFVNTLVMRNYPTGGKSFKQFLFEVKESTLQAFSNQNYPFEEIVEKMNIKREVHRNPLFDTMFVLQNFEQQQLTLDRMQIELYELKSQFSKFDFMFEVTEMDGDLHLNVEYATQLYSQEKMEQIVEFYIDLLNLVTQDLNIKIDDLGTNLSSSDHNINANEYNEQFEF
ncbi:amino acid adenylation domain-containing protein [Chengkuizengella sp. SCS-71B]|uniref:amino acid adenylation domain-containing protein n=1 Tax=Chengkuizengella sp. SCS-71B TaxID=3115290 RepID=UPI0032C224C2